MSTQDPLSPKAALPSQLPFPSAHLIQQHLLQSVHLGGAGDEPVQNPVPASDHRALKANPGAGGRDAGGEQEGFMSPSAFPKHETPIQGKHTLRMA